MEQPVVIDKRLLGILRCPVSRGTLVPKQDELWCKQSGLAYPVRDGIPVLLETDARPLSQEDLEVLEDS